METREGLPRLVQVFPRDGSLGDTSIDIIAVHGIETHSPKTWIAYERDEEPRGRAINWLCDEDMLPLVVPQARVWVYDYNSNCWSDQAGTVTLLAHGDVFLDLLWATMAMDQQIGRRPLIFIGSYFGGIVVAQALVRASEDQPRYASFLNSVIGVIFLGTPLRGTPVASMAQWVGLIHGFVGKETSDTLLMELEDRNDMLGHVIQDFAKMARLCKLEIRCFYETRRTQVLNAVAKRWIARLFPEINLVSKESACLDGYKHIALDARHAMMNKFRGPHDGRFILVSSSVKELADESRISRNRSIEELECIQAFASNYKGDKDRNPPRVQGTCMWLLEHPKYISWCQEEYASLLWVTADPGCGKSVLAKALVDEEHLMPRYETTSMCYFFFKDDDPARQTGANALSAILHQLFVQKPALVQHAIYDFRNNGGQLCNMFSTLWEILINAATDPNAGEIVCVLDALDETQESARGELLSYLSYFYASRDETMAKLYFLVTSRPYADIERGFCWGSAEGTEATCINLRGENESDQISKEIDIVIDDQLPRIANARRPRLDPEVLSRLTIHLKMTPHRTYLWLHLIFDIIRKSLDSTAPRLERLVNTLPRTVEEAYEKILNRSNHRKSARRLLHMVVGAIRPLTLRELNIACAIDELHESGEPCQRYSHLDLESEDAFRAKARNVCGLFVIIVDSKIYLIHQTAKEFLLSQTSNDLAEVSQCDSNVWKQSLDQFDSQFIMLKICFSYLLIRELEDPVLFREAKDSWSDSQPQLAHSAPPYIFLNYAAVAWITHFRKSRSRDTGLLLQRALDVCDTQSNRFERWYRIYQSGFNSYYNVPRYSRDLSRLTVASFFGLRPIVEVLLKENGIDLNPRDESGNTPLGLAVYHGYFETVKLLAEQDDIDINAGMRDVGSPLHLAARQNHLEIVKLLVEKDGIDLNGKSGGGGTALETALNYGHLEVAKLLINKYSIDKRCFHVGDGDEKMPKLSWDEEPDHLISMAINFGDLEIVELCIERKAFGINQKDRDGTTPLVMAIQDEMPAVVRLLVGKEGIDLNLKGPKGRTPLAWAVRKGNAEIVNILLKKDGIEVNCKDAAGQTPLGIARSYPPGFDSDGLELIDLLVEHNASDPTAPWLTKAYLKERHARD